MKKRVKRYISARGRERVSGQIERREREWRLAVCPEENALG